MEERALLAIILSILIIFLYQYFFIPRPKIKKEEPIDIKEDIVIEKKEKKSVLETEFYDDLLEKQKVRKERGYIIETGKYRARFSNKGGKLIEWKLKKYFEEPKYETWPLKWSFWIQVGKAYQSIFKNKEKDNKKKEWVDLVPEINNEGKGSLDIMLISEMNEEEEFGEGFYDVREEEFIDGNSRIKALIMSYLDKRGILIEKELRFFEDNYRIEMNLKLKNISNRDQNIDYGLFWGPGIGKGTMKSGHHRFVGPVLWIDGKKKRIKPKKIKDTIVRKGMIEWVAFEKTYFAAAIIPKIQDSEAFIFKNNDNAENGQIYVGIRHPIRDIKAGDEVLDQYELYIGPKRKQDLNNVSSHFNEIIDYGWFSFLARPLIWFLNLSYKAIPNYGIAIIILTVIIKIVFWPLTEKSFGSMKDMQKMQPKMAAIREKYKSDPARMNKEVMDLYKKHGVNPLGGCLPMILQIPVFFALFEGLLVAIEMRGAPFMLWIHDLSAMDPLLITPVLMGITMYIQQKMMPTGMDPKQAKMMNMMPVLFTVFFLGFPSGLVIYWLLNNVLTIGHQYLIHKRTEKAEGSHDK